MNHREKVNHYLEEMRRRGLNKYDAAPPIYRLLWRLGFKIPPPLCQTFFPLVVFMGTLFGSFYGGLMWLIAWRTVDVSFAVNVVIGLIAGLFFGVSMATYYRWKARRLNLPLWDRYPFP